MLNQITDDDLRDMYWTQNLSGKEIAKRLGCSPAAVCMRMKASGIMARKRWEYPATEKQRVTWIRIGKQSAGKKRSAKTRKAISESRTGFRAKEYEFGGHEKKRTERGRRHLSPAGSKSESGQTTRATSGAPLRLLRTRLTSVGAGTTVTPGTPLLRLQRRRLPSRAEAFRETSCRWRAKTKSCPSDGR